MRKLVLLVLLAACSSAPPRPLPSVDWTKGAAVFVQTPTTLPYYGPESVPGLKKWVENDLRAAGLRVEQQQENQGELQMLIGDAVNPDSMEGSFPITLIRDGDTVDRLDVKLYELSCWPRWRDEQASVACLGREFVAHVLESQKVAAAMRHKPAQRPPAAQAQTALPGRTLAGKLAVLELRNFTKDLTHENAQYFTDVVRSAALKAQPQLEVMTRENLLVLLEASGKDLAACEGECEVDTGRRIGADLIVSGELQKVGSRYKMTLRLHDTREGRLLASTQASGKSIEELDDAGQKAAADLLGGR